MNVMVGFMAEFNARFSWNPPYSSYEAVCWVIWFIYMLEYPLIFSCWNTPSYFQAKIFPHIFMPEYSLTFLSAISVGMAADRKCKVWSQRLHNKDFLVSICCHFGFIQACESWFEQENVANHAVLFLLWILWRRESEKPYWGESHPFKQTTQSYNQ